MSCKTNTFYMYMYIVREKSGGPEQKGIRRTAVSSLLALISIVQYNLPWDPHGLYTMYIYPSSCGYVHVHVSDSLHVHVDVLKVYTNFSESRVALLISLTLMVLQYLTRVDGSEMLNMLFMMFTRTALTTVYREGMGPGLSTTSTSAPTPTW